jgi:hypothetical protein
METADRRKFLNYLDWKKKQFIHRPEKHTATCDEVHEADEEMGETVVGKSKPVT